MKKILKYKIPRYGPYVGFTFSLYEGSTILDVQFQIVWNAGVMKTLRDNPSIMLSDGPSMWIEADDKKSVVNVDFMWIATGAKIKPLMETFVKTVLFPDQEVYHLYVGHGALVAAQNPINRVSNA